MAELENRAMKELEDKQLEKEGRTEILMKEITADEVPELSVSIEVGEPIFNEEEMKGIEDKEPEKEGRTEILMKENTESEVPELSVSIEDIDDDDADSVGEPKSNIPDKVNGEEIPPVELPASDDGSCTNLSCLLNTMLDNIQEIVA